LEPVELQTLDAETERAIQAILRLRQQAWQVVSYEAQAYWLALFFYALARLRQYEADIQYTRHQLSRYLHSLLSAAMLCRKLLPQVERMLPAQALHSLWVNEAEQEVWVEGKNVDLAPTEYDLLLVLYRRANQLCSRQDISQALYRLDYGLETEDTINTTMTRLRRKIEAGSTPGKYIITVRGKGYRLKLD
jgi:DNA-binding response OmpR family regulator